MRLTFQECKIAGYRYRTIKNASADMTLAFALNFKSAGERLTKKSVLAQNKLYMPISLDNKNINYDDIIHAMKDKHVRSINIAGNGIYTIRNYNMDQADIDNYVFNVLSNINDKYDDNIKLIRSGGQTGADEAGIKAAIELDIDALVYAPRWWVFRDITGKDISNEKLFKQRFLDRRPFVRP